MTLRDEVYYPEHSDGKVKIRVGIITGIIDDHYIIRATTDRIIHRCKEHCYPTLEDARHEYPRT